MFTFALALTLFYYFFETFIMAMFMLHLCNRVHFAYGLFLLTRMLVV